MVTTALVIYGIIWALTVRPLTGHIAWHQAINTYHQSKPDFGDWLWYGMGAAFLALFWPICLLVLASGKFLPKIGAEREAQVRLQKERIKELERELNI